MGASTKPLRVRSGRAGAVASEPSLKSALQRSRCVFAAEGLQSRQAAGHRHPASTKPLRVRSGRRIRNWMVGRRCEASTKPLRVRSGRNISILEITIPICSLQRSRCVFAAEGLEQSNQRHRLLRFNEAAACSQRKGIWPPSSMKSCPRLQRSRCVFAAEGLSSCEDRRCPPFCFNEAAACSQRKVLPSRIRQFMGNMASTKPLRVRSGRNGIGHRRPSRSRPLQRSRCVFAAEGFAYRKILRRCAPRASTKPLRVRSGRFLSSSSRSRARRRFNEAAACSQRKAPRPGDPADGRRRFNEAAACSQRKACAET